MKSLLAVIGTRPEAIKMFPIVHALMDEPGITTRLCVSGQHRDLVDPVLQMASLRPDFDLDVMAPNQALDALFVRLLIGVGKVIDQALPSRVLVQGDTMTTKAAALAAHYRRVPVAHVEAGLRSNNMQNPWPEEANRRITSIVSDLHFAPTRTAADALIAEGVCQRRVHVTGNTGIDALRFIQDGRARGPCRAADLDRLLLRVAGKKIILATSHRRESFGAPLRGIIRALATLAQHDGVAVVIPLHPNPNVRPIMEAHLAHCPNVVLVEPLSYPLFVRLLHAADLVLTDSGGVQEEAPFFGKPVLVLREATERPEGVAANTAQLVGCNPEDIVRAAVALLDDPVAYARMANAQNPYGDGYAASRIAQILAADLAALN